MLSISPESNFSPLKRNELENLKSNLEKCNNVLISVAYMTDWYFDQKLTSLLIDKLREDKSYILVDSSNPTNHDYCHYLKQAGCNIYFAEKKYQRVFKESAKLMHTKIYLFDFGTEVEIWIGSMNLTREGVCGENLECSIKYKCQKSDPLYIETIEYMEFIKSHFCSPWPNSNLEKKLIKLYKQNDPDFNRFLGNLENCILFVTADIKKLSLQVKSYINIFFLGDKVADLKKGSSYTFIILDSKRQVFYNTKCKITQIADIDNGKSSLEIVDPKPFAIHPLYNDYLYLFEDDLFSLIQKNLYVKSIITLQINNEIQPILNLYKPQEKEEFYTTILDSNELRITDFNRILALKGTNNIKSEIPRPISNFENPASSLNKFLGDLENFNLQLSAESPTNLFYNLDLKKKIKVLNEILVDRGDS